MTATAEHAAAAGGIALINAVGSVSGWVGPSVVGWLEDRTGKISAGLFVVAALEVLGAVLILVFMRHSSGARADVPNF